MPNPGTLEARKALQRQIEYRRDKLRKIFSWSATLLVAMTGDIVALKSDPGRSELLANNLGLQGAVVVAIVGVLSYSWK